MLLSRLRPDHESMRSFAFAIVIALIGLICLALAEVDTDRWISEPWVRDAPSTQGAQNGSVMPDLVSFNITENEPSAMVLGGKDIAYREYSARNRSGELWIDKEGRFSQYATSSAGVPLTVVAYAPQGGSVDLYRIDYSHNATYHKQYELLPGYSSGEVALSEPGRIMMIMAINDQPSNALIIDVTPEEKPAARPANLNNFYIGAAKLAVTSNWLKGFDVYVDGVYRTSDQKDGSEDGNATLEVGGGRTHTITVAKIGGLAGGPYKSEYVKKFDSGMAYTLKI